MPKNSSCCFQCPLLADFYHENISMCCCVYPIYASCIFLQRKHLLQIGGRGLREIGVNAMKAVLAHDVQVLYSLHGRKGKRAFVNLRLCRLVTDVICQKAGCDQAEALNFIKRWLPGSGDRCGGRKRRFREAFVVEQHDDAHSQSADYRLLAAAGFLPSHSSQGLDSTTVTVPPTQPDLQ
ncbi:uncharacterized protein LOC142776014 isoform X1 [Rhipicephalus microplus]|uniref:uncharacterized protein LOC142765433 isoform X1 n=1 Tax=Rhipicephalus microplus TaxID=6941 RepID=UPI003F6B203B